MKNLNEKLNALRRRLKDDKVKIMIIGLGSVGCYLLDYLMSAADENMEITVVGRSAEKMIQDVNIVRVSALIRGQNRTQVKIVPEVDLNSVDDIVRCLESCTPDIIVNSSRAYPGLKYGSISWKNVRAYGIWCPLSVKYIKNIMSAYERAGSDAIVVNTSYSDAVIPWLKTAGKAYPDFGSGNINHLLPRIKFAVAENYGISDFWNIDVTYAVSHFHDVVISKEGHTEGVEQLIKITYNDEILNPDMNKIFASCKIPMPVDAKRNMMNASSNFEIIRGILAAARDGKKVKLHCPGVFGEVGGYPVILDGTGIDVKSYIDESVFTLEQMRAKNAQSIYLDGIEKVENGILYYTDELLQKVESAFGAELVKCVPLEKTDETADFIIREIIERYKEN